MANQLSQPPALWNWVVRNLLGHAGMHEQLVIASGPTSELKTGPRRKLDVTLTRRLAADQHIRVDQEAQPPLSALSIHRLWARAVRSQEHAPLGQPPLLNGGNPHGGMRVGVEREPGPDGTTGSGAQRSPQPPPTAPTIVTVECHQA